MKLYSNVEQDGNKKVSLLNITVYECKNENRTNKKKFLYGLIKIKSAATFKKLYFLGIKIYEKSIQLNYFGKLNEISNNIYFYNLMPRAVERLHSSIFPQFKNKHNGESAAIIATGPTMLHYSKLPNCLHFGVNNAYKKLTPDYWFAIDAQNLVNNFDELKQTDFIKFYGQCITPFPLHRYISEDKSTIYHIPDCVIDNSKNGFKFYFDHPSLKINRDIETQPLPDLGSCVFSAMYFAIYAGIKKIYVVGCDCACNGYFDGSKQKPEWEDGSVTEKLLRGWNIFKDYVEIFHPDVEIISINPIGLKGMFKDVYTKSYLEANPQIKEELGKNIEILGEDTNE